MFIGVGTCQIRVLASWYTLLVLCAVVFFNSEVAFLIV
jgi:hypothetical protein